MTDDMMSNYEPNFFLTFKLRNQDLLDNFRKIQLEFLGRNKDLHKYLEPLGKVKNSKFKSLKVR